MNLDSSHDAPELIQVSKCSLHLCRFQKMYSPKFIIPEHSPKLSSVIAGNIPSCIHQHTSRPTSITQPARQPTAGSDQERRFTYRNLVTESQNIDQLTEK